MTLPASSVESDIARHSPPDIRPTPAELELLDWNAYYDMLSSGQLRAYGGKYVVVFRGKVVAAGDDPRELRRQVAEKERLAPESIVIPFVDAMECLVAE